MHVTSKNENCSILEVCFAINCAEMLIDKLRSNYDANFIKTRIVVLQADFQKQLQKLASLSTK